jgi:hypothetical protein
METCLQTNETKHYFRERKEAWERNRVALIKSLIMRDRREALGAH